MNLQITPYCEHKEEIGSFPGYQNFFVGMDFIITKKNFMVGASVFLKWFQSKSIKINKSAQVFKNFQVHGERQEIHLKIHQIVAFESNQTCMFL